MVLYSDFCKFIIIIQFFITNHKCKYSCGHWWNLTSAAHNIYTCVSYIVLNRIITCMVQLVKYYYKTLFAANLNQKKNTELAINMCSWEFTGVSRADAMWVEQQQCTGPGHPSSPGASHHGLRQFVPDGALPELVQLQMIQPGLSLGWREMSHLQALLPGRDTHSRGGSTASLMTLMWIGK